MLRPPPRSTLFPTRRSSDLFNAASRGESPRSMCCSTASTTTMASSDRKSTRLNSSHLGISYAVFCLKKKTTIYTNPSADLSSTEHIDAGNYIGNDGDSLEDA